METVLPAFFGVNGGHKNDVIPMAPMTISRRNARIEITFMLIVRRDDYE
jgi:hypothetical protein